MKYLKLNTLETIIKSLNENNKELMLSVLKTLVNNKHRLQFTDNYFDLIFLSCLPQISTEVKEIQFVILLDSIASVKKFLKEKRNILESNDITVNSLLNIFSKGEVNTVATDKRNVLVGTPGIFLKTLKDESLDNNFIQIVLFKDCDSLFELGYREDIKGILSQLDPDTKEYFFYNNKIEALDTFLKEEEIDQFTLKDLDSIKVDEFNRPDLTVDFIDKDKKTLILVKETKDVEQLFLTLHEHNIRFNYLAKSNIKKGQEESYVEEDFYDKEVIIANKNALENILFKYFSLIIDYNLKKINNKGIVNFLAYNPEAIRNGFVPQTLNYSRKGATLLRKSLKRSMTTLSKLSNKILDSDEEETESGISF